MALNQTWNRLALVLLVSTSHYALGQILPVRGAPFSAVVRDEKKRPIIEMARASDGSQYSGSAIVDGEPRQIFIVNNSQGCSLSGQVFEISDRLKPIFILEPIDPSSRTTHTVDETEDALREQQKSLTMVRAHTNPDVSTRRLSLGEKKVDGMTIFGFRSETKLESGRYEIQEEWESELGFNYSRRYLAGFDVRKFPKELHVTDLRRDEPDPNLFAIAPKHFPRLPAFAGAKTVFVSYPEGQKEQADQVAVILTRSGQLSMVSNPSNADLVINFAFAPVQDGPASPTHPNSAYLTFQSPGSTAILFEIQLQLYGKPEKLHTAIRDSCLATLWPKIEDAK